MSASARACSPNAEPASTRPTNNTAPTARWASRRSAASAPIRSNTEASSNGTSTPSGVTTVRVLRGCSRGPALTPAHSEVEDPAPRGRERHRVAHGDAAHELAEDALDQGGDQ